MYKVMDAQKQAPNNWQSNKNSSSQSGPRPSGCLFCSEPAHNIRYCPQVEDYVNKGLCKKDARGYTTLPDNSNIGRYLPGKNLMERIDSWHKANPSQIHKVSANFISASPTSEKKQIYTWNNSDSIKSLQILWKLRKKRMKMNILSSRFEKSKNSLCSKRYWLIPKRKSRTPRRKWRRKIKKTLARVPRQTIQRTRKLLSPRKILRQIKILATTRRLNINILHQLKMSRSSRILSRARSMQI